MSCCNQPAYKLTYFDLRGRAEVARLMFSLAKVKFTDDRIQPADWMARKDDSPFGQLPMLAINDTVICQMEAINEYLARQFGYAGENSLENAQITMIANCINDTVSPAFTIFFAKEEKEQMKDIFETKQLPGNLAKLEKLLASNDGGNCYFVGSKLSYADLKLLYAMDMISAIKVDLDMAKYPKLDSLRNRLLDSPQIKEYIVNRPVTAL